MLCVISKEQRADGWRDLQTNSLWTKNPNPAKFAVVPTEMVEEIFETFGFCDIEVENNVVVSFIALPLPEPEEPVEPAPELTVWDELDAAYQKGVNTAYDE